MGKPYVISAELDLETAGIGEILELRKVDNFRENLDADLRAIGKETYWVPSSTISGGLGDVIARTRIPVISLDDRYVNSADNYLGISRGVDPLLNDDGYVARRNFPSIEDQLRNVSGLGSEVLLVDDVLFSGELIFWLAETLRLYGVRIGAVAVGIAISDGIDKLEAEGIDVVATQIFDEVDDEICERDFAIVPGSGRRINELTANSLYFDIKYGRPEKWASIKPDATSSFCANSLCRSINLLRRGIAMKDIGKFLGYGIEGSAKEQITKRLEEL